VWRHNLSWVRTEQIQWEVHQLIRAVTLMITSWIQITNSSKLQVVHKTTKISPSKRAKLLQTLSTSWRNSSSAKRWKYLEHRTSTQNVYLSPCTNTTKLSIMWLKAVASWLQRMNCWDLKATWMVKKLIQNFKKSNISTQTSPMKKLTKSSLKKEKLKLRKLRSIPAMTLKINVAGLWLPLLILHVT